MCPHPRPSKGQPTPTYPRPRSPPPPIITIQLVSLLVLSPSGMSFNDLNDLEAQPSSFSNPTNASPAFSSLTKAISQKIFSITSNVALVHRYIGLLGTPRDTDRMRSSLMDTLGKTKTIIKEIVPDIRQLSRWDPEEIGPGGKYEQ